MCTVAFGTAVLSAILGMAGGIILLTVMLFYLDPVPAIAVHGIVQLVSNSSRTFVQRRHVAWNLTWRYAVLLLPMGFLGVQIAFRLPPHFTKLAIGVFVLVATWRPHWLWFGAETKIGRPETRFFALGGAIGFLSTLIGATGPLLAPFFLNLELPRQGVVGTKAACQTLGHVSKAIVFGLAGFAYLPFAGLVAAMSGCVVAGTWLGSRWLERVDDVLFTRLFKTTLTLIALRFVLFDGWKWLSGA